MTDRPKKKPRINKTKIVEDRLKKEPDISPQELAAELTQKGIKMSPGYISTIKSSLRRKRTPSKNGGTTIPALRAIKEFTEEYRDSREIVDQVIALIDLVGKDELPELIEVLAERRD